MIIVSQFMQFFASGVSGVASVWLGLIDSTTWPRHDPRPLNKRTLHIPVITQSFNTLYRAGAHAVSKTDTQSVWSPCCAMQAVFMDDTSG